MAIINGDGVQTTLTGTADADVITGAAIAETLIGLQGDDTLDGGGGDDVIRPGASVAGDMILGSAGSDTIDVDPASGGQPLDTGFDYAQIDWSGLGVALDLTYAPDAISAVKDGIGTDSVIGLSALRGANGLSLRSGAQDDTFDLTGAGLWFLRILPGGGDDVIDGGDSYARLSYIDAPAGVTVNIDGRGADGSFGTAQDGFGGTDAFSDINEIQGSSHDDTFNGGAGRDTLVSSGGNDVIDGGDERDMVRFDRGAAADFIAFDGATDIVSGEIDGLAFTVSLTRVEEVRGSGGDDTFVGGAGSDATRFAGMGGDDTIRFNGASNEMNGRLSQGNDSFDFADPDVTGDEYYSLDGFDISGSIVMQVSGGAGTIVKDGAGTDTLLNVDQIGDGLQLLGGSGNDRYEASLAEGQSSRFRGRGGDDTFIGGDGFDIYSFESFDAPMGAVVTVTSGAGEDMSGTALDPWGGTDTFTNVDRVEGTTLDDVLNGGASDDEFISLEGDDQVNGEGGFDRIRYDRSGVDRVDVNLGTGEVANVWRGVTYTDVLTGMEQIRGSRAGEDVFVGDGAENEFWTFDGDDVQRGNGGDDELEDFGTGNDRFFGGAGNDWIRGDVGADLLNGGRGEDELRGETGGDEIVGAGGRDQAWGGGGGDVIGGGASVDFLAGDKGKDRIDGGGGNDEIVGGRQNDRLTGGKGRDAFVFDAGDGKNDVILDWEGRDRIRFDSGPDDFGDLTIQNKGKHVLVRYGGRDKIKILNTEPEELQANDFLFA